ncbi:hypothetical protein [Pseudomonas luteola]|uniref:hypothetical protein n=1 Tax=Pseudomonas luteola TaxID=47886 RepID=UPI001239F324|nr:hypothetical protein [Pseudomonas luteola]QEU31444.1 hypothetical protein FOB45_27120 [Pseudomonas luteola]
MSKLYSPSDAAFFDSSVHSVIPKDAIQISDALYETYSRAAPLGRSLSWTAVGCLRCPIRLRRQWMR